MPESVKGSEVTGWERTLKQAFELWITPELERRKSAGSIGSDFKLAVAQILFTDEGAPKVRLNGEVKGIVQARVARPVKKGDPVGPHDIADYVGMELLEEDRDYGHFTLIQHHDKWVMLFDFSRNKGHATELIDLAEQFANIAEYCLNAKHHGPFIDNLFSASELLARARLITTILKRDSSRTHGHIHSTINSWRKLGNVGDEFVDLFNILSRARVAARYSGQISSAVVKESSVQVVRTEIELLRSRYRPKLPDTG